MKLTVAIIELSFVSSSNTEHISSGLSAVSTPDVMSVVVIQSPVSLGLSLVLPEGSHDTSKELKYWVWVRSAYPQRGSG